MVVRLFRAPANSSQQPDRVPFVGSAAEPPLSAQAPTASRRLQIASCGFRSGAADRAPLCRWHLKARGG
jgi:hypothetical protein